MDLENGYFVYGGATTPPQTGYLESINGSLTTPYNNPLSQGVELMRPHPVVPLHHDGEGRLDNLGFWFISPGEKIS
jgi:hypothetical protein